MAKRRSIPVSGPLAEHENGYRAWLVELGYKPKSMGVLVGLVGRLSIWMDHRGLDVGDLCGAVVEEFLTDLRAGGGWFQPSVATLGSFLDYLRDAGAVGFEVPPVPVTASEETIKAFGHFLEFERGLTPGAIRTYVWVSTAFLTMASAKLVPLPSHTNLTRWQSLPDSVGELELVLK